jgi:hypothetical protein
MTSTTKVLDSGDVEFAFMVGDSTSLRIETVDPSRVVHLTVNDTVVWVNYKGRETEAMIKFATHQEAVDGYRTIQAQKNIKMGQPYRHHVEP